MSISLTDEQRAEAVASIKQYAAENFDEPLGDLAAGFLLDYFVAEIGPSIYNRGVRDTQERVQAAVMDVDMDLREAEFTFWKTRRRT
ncbi:MAG: DUF2164 domain-containing protein [Rhodothermales bacterium]|nr:DUF2164 domain-containing protein [Rhodothermales bacterium]